MRKILTLSAAESDRGAVAASVAAGLSLRLGQEGIAGGLLKATIDTAVQTKAVRPAQFERVIIDTTVQEKAIAHPVDSRLLEIARSKVVQAAKIVGITLKQTFVKEGKELRRKAGGYAHAKQFKRLRRALTWVAQLLRKRSIRPLAPVRYHR